MTRILSILFIFFFSGLASVSAEVQYPFLGEFNADKVNVRGGPNQNFEKLFTASQGQQVVVIAENFGWYKIKLPVEASAYVSEDLIEMVRDQTGVSKGNRVNIRAGAGTKFSVLGQLKKGEVVKIRKNDNGWYEIEPVDQSFGWVASEYIKFKAAEVPPPKVVEFPSRSIYRKAEAPSEDPAANPAVQPSAAQPETELPGEAVTVIGRLDVLKSNTAASPFRLIQDDGTVYYLKGPDQLMERFVHYKVKIDGTLRQDPQKTNAPVVTIAKIHLIL